MQKLKEMAVDSAQYRVTLRSMILRRAWLRAVWYCRESISKNSNISTKIKTILTHYSVAQAGSNYEKTGQKSRWTVPLHMIQKSQITPRSMILHRTWLRAVWYCAELDSEQYDTAGSFVKIRISRRKLNPKQNYFNPLVKGPGRFEWWKKLDVKNLVGLSL